MRWIWNAVETGHVKGTFKTRIDILSVSQFLVIMLNIEIIHTSQNNSNINEYNVIFHLFSGHLSFMLLLCGVSVIWLYTKLYSQVMNINPKHQRQ